VPLALNNVSTRSWEVVSEEFNRILELPLDERSNALAEMRATNPELQRQVAQLLEGYENSPEFLNVPDSPAIPQPLALFTFQPGQLLCDRFLIKRLLGVGGMGEVYEVEDARMGCVAVKTMRPQWLCDPAMVERFNREVLRSRTVTHPAVCSAFDLHLHRTEEGAQIPLFTMRLLEGETLAAYLAREGPLPVGKALLLLEQIASALDAAHAAGIVHRDLKPANIFVQQEPQRGMLAIVTDFGIAAQVGSSPVPWNSRVADEAATTAFGAPAYMAPEQCRGEPATPAADIYALALLATEMVCGHRVYPFRSALACIMRKTHEPRPTITFPPEVPSRWRRAIARALDPVPQNRFSSAGTFVAELRPHSATKHWRWLSAIVLFAALGLSGFGLWWGREDPSVAVLPFANRTGDPELVYFTDGLAGEITTGLAMNRKLQVIAKAAAFQYRNSEDLAKVSQALQARMLLTGSVERRNGRLIVTAELVEGRTRRQLWAGQFQRDPSHIATLDREIAREVISRMTNDAEAGREQRPLSADAHEAYLKARYFEQARTAEGLLKARDYYRRAVDLEPNFVQAMAGWASVETLMVDYGLSTTANATPVARDLLQRALLIAPDQAEALAVRASFRSLLEWDQQGAEPDYRAAIERAPSLAVLHHWYGTFLMRSKRFEEALHQAEIARKLDPVTAPTRMFEGWIHFYKRDYARAIEVAHQVLELKPDFPHAFVLLAECYALSGQTDQALAALRSSQAFTRDESLKARYATTVYSELPGYQSQTRGAIENLRTLSPGRQLGNIAIAFAGIGDTAEMYKALEQAVAIREPSVAIANLHPNMDRYRHEQRFTELSRKLGYR
jgi:eukaryotic-like serine/threonine-protein kinase